MGAFHYAKLTGQRSVGIPVENEMEHFPIKSGRPIEMAVVILNPFTEFPNKGEEPVCHKWNGEFRSEYSEYSDRNMWTTYRGGPEYSSQKKPKRTFHLNFDIIGIMESTPYFGWNIPTEIRRSIFDKPVLCPDKGIRKEKLKWQEPFLLVGLV